MPVANVALNQALLLAAVWYTRGLLGLLERRKEITRLGSRESMLNGEGREFGVGGSRWQQADGQIMFILVLSLAAAEVAVGLALALPFYHRFLSLGSDSACEFSG